MNEQRLRGLMGLCLRAGQGIFGEDSCLKALRKGQAALMLMDGSISADAAEKVKSVSQLAGTQEDYDLIEEANAVSQSYALILNNIRLMAHNLLSPVDRDVNKSRVQRIRFRINFYSLS